MSDFAITTTEPFKFTNPEDITPENLNKILEWIAGNNKDTEDKIRTDDDRINTLE